MVEKIFEELKNIPEVEAIALGGSRVGEEFDEKSDYDVCFYCTDSIGDDVRRAIINRRQNEFITTQH